MATTLDHHHQQRQPIANRRITCRNPQWTYLKLELITHPHQPNENPKLDHLTARTYLTAALSQFLGLLGTSISLDILKIDNSLSSRQVLWIRVPREDAAGVVGALSSWVGQTTSPSSSSGGSGSEGSVAWRICAKGNFLGAIVHGSGGDVFDG